MSSREYVPDPRKFPFRVRTSNFFLGLVPTANKAKRHKPISVREETISRATHLDSDRIVDSVRISARLKIRVVLNVGSVHQHLVSVAIVAVLFRPHKSAVLVHVQEVIKYVDLFDLNEMNRKTHASIERTSR